MTITNNLGQTRVGVRVASGGGGIDTDAQAFITAASITDSTQQSAINTLVTQLKTYGIWTKMKAVYPFVGGTAAQHKFNLKDPRDLDAAFRLRFDGGGTHSSTGYLPNGINSSALTFLSPSANQTLTSAHFSLYSRTSGKSLSTSYYAASGCYNSASNASYIITNRYIDNTIGGPMWSESGGGVVATVASTPDGRGFWMTSRTANNALNFYKNGTSIISNTTTQSSTSLPTYAYRLGSINGTPTGEHDNKELAFASLGEGLSSTESANFYTAVQTFQTTLGRQVGVPIVADADAQAFLNAAVITDQTQANAVNTLVTDLKSANIWSKMKAIYPFVGGSASSHKFNLKDPRDLDAAYRLVFNGGWTHSSTGALPNGTNAYADTKLVPSAVQTLNSNGMGVYLGTLNTSISSDPVHMGVFESSTQASTLSINKANTNITSRLNGNIITSSTINGLGLISTHKTSSTLTTLYKNSTNVGNGNSGGSLSNVQIALANISANPSSFFIYGNGWTNAEQRLAYISDGLDSTDMTNLYNAVQAYQTTLSRNV